jgi:hypothetical protein
MFKGRREIMLFARKFIFTLLVLVIVAALVVFLLVKREDTLHIINRQISIKIPSTVKILNSSYDKKYDELGVKMLIHKDEINTIKKEIDACFAKKKLPKNDLSNLPLFKNVYSWWDLNISEIEDAYHCSMYKETGLGHTSREVWIFITKDKSGDYMLYLSSL